MRAAPRRTPLRFAALCGLAGAAVGTFSTAGAGAGRFNSPHAVAINPANGDVAVAEFGNNQISSWAPTGG